MGKNAIIKLIPNYGELVMFGCFFVIFGCFFLSAFNFWYALFFFLFMLLLFYWILSRVGIIEFFDDYVIFKTNFGKNQVSFSYNDIEYAQYSFGKFKGNSSLKIVFINPFFGRKAVAYDGNSLEEIKRLAFFLKSKNVNFRVIPSDQEPKILPS